LALIVWDPVPTSCVVTVTEQVPPFKVQLVGLMVSPLIPMSEELNEMVPAEVDDPVPDVSETVTDTVLEPFTLTEMGVSVTTVEVLRALTV
jgi:hypothetical protein